MYTSASASNAIAPMSRWEFLGEGIRHILTGYDHVPFLLCLLLPAVMRRSAKGWRSVDRLSEAILPVLGIVTALVGLKELTGARLSPMDAYLVPRGLKTLTIRMDRHCRSAQTVAEFLAERPEVGVVHYPGLPSHPQHALSKRQMRQPGGMLAFELHGGVDAGRRFMNALRLVARAVSLGDAESLAQHPASTTHAPYSPAQRERHLIPEGLVRLSGGLEDVDDLLDDLAQALEASRAPLFPKS